MLKSSKLQRGVTLIESLVAIVVMALGVLGVLGIQLRTLADTQTGVRRAQAIRLIEDLSERIKVNPNGLGNMGTYVSGWNATLPAVTVDCRTAACDSANLANFDRNLWITSVRSVMPLGDANIFLAADDTDPNNRRQLGVMVSWRENERDQKKADGTADTAYTAGTATASTGTANVSCPAGRTCHLQYIQPTARCTPWVNGGAAVPQLFCP